MSYIEWVKNSFRKLEQDYLSGTFEPQNERDLNAHLYHCVFQNKPDKDLLIFTEATKKYLNSNNKEISKRIDLVIVKKDGENKQTCLLVEIKESRSVDRAPRAPGVIGRISKDIEKLDKFMNQFHCKGIMIFFYLKKYPKGMPTELKSELEEEFKKQFGDRIVFLFGPRRMT